MVNLDLLYPYVKKKALELIDLCAKNGIKIIYTASKRDKAEQDGLYEQGRTKGIKGKTVTDVKYPYSYHNWGLAVDFVPIVNGKAEWDDLKLFERVGILAESIGFEWGGRWKKPIDRPHLQITCGLEIKDLIAGKIPVFPQEKTIIKWKEFEFEVLDQTEKCKVLKLRSWGTTVYITKTLLQYADVKVEIGKQPREKVSDFYKRVKPKFLINGGLFAMNNGNTMAIIKDKTGLYGDNGFYFDGYCMTVKGGKIEFVQLNHFEDAKNYDYAIEVAPSLVKSGQVSMDTKGLDKGFLTGKHPRQAIGFDDAFFYTITTDGREESECGLTIEQLACLCKDLGMIYAGNLDGGGSTKLYVDGKKINSMDEDRAVDNFVYVNLK